MKRVATRLPGLPLALWLAAFGAAPSGLAGEQGPHLGYIYPAGAQQGTTAELTIGGQNLAGARDVRITGGGAQATFLRYVRAMSQGVINDLQDKLAEAADLERRRQAATDEGDTELVSKLGLLIAKTIDEFELMATKAGVEDPSPRGFAELRRKLSDPKRQLNPQLAESVVVRVTLAPSAEPGERELRLCGPSGASNPLFFHVSQCREYLEKEPNDRTPDGDALTVKVDDMDFPNLGELPVVLNGQIMPGDVDRFRFEIKKGTRLVAAVSARSLIPYLADAVPGWFQATLRLCDAKGNELAFSDDFRFQPDPLIYYEIPQTGLYILEIHDAIYRGREDFVYRISVGQLPFVTGVFPLGGQAGAKTAASVEGWNLPVSTLTLNTQGKAPGVLPVSVAAGKHVSNPVPFALSALPECAEAEPNDDAQRAQPLTPPVIVNGRVAGPGDRDLFRFEGKEGDEVVVEVEARRLGSPLDSQLRLTDATGKMIAFNDDFEDRGTGLNTHHADSFLRAKLPAAGVYYVHLADTQNKGGSAYAYRLRVSPPRPDFELRIVPSCINARPGATVAIAVYALRRDGFTGEIALKPQQAPQGLALAGARIPAGEDDVRLTLLAPPIPQSGPVRFSLEGRATIQGTEVSRVAVPAEDMMQAFAYHHLVPSRDGLLLVTGSPVSTPPLTRLGDEPLKLAPDGTAEVRFAVAKGARALEMQVELDDPPKGIAIQKITGEDQTVIVVFSADAKEARPGQKGNLILNAVREFTPEAREGAPAPTRQRASLGMLPALPFEIGPAPAPAAMPEKPKAN